MNPLDTYPALRKALYFAQWVVNLVLGVIAIVLTTQGESPQWFIIVGAVFNFIWSYTGITAQTNTVTEPAYHYSPADGALEDYAARGAEVSGNDEGVINPEA